MALMRKTDLVKKGAASLEDASRSLVTGDYKEADIAVGIADAYARLADALGDSSFLDSKAGNW